MRVRAVVEFDVDKPTLYDGHLDMIAQELRYTLEDEHNGIAEYLSCVVLEITEITDVD